MKCDLDRLQLQRFNTVFNTVTTVVTTAETKITRAERKSKIRAWLDLA